MIRTMMANASQPADTATTPGNSWLDLLSLKLQWSGIFVHVGWLLIGVIVLLVIAIPLVRMWLRRRKWAAQKVKLAFPNLFEMEICPDHETARIAYQAWVEITTRKAGLPFDPEHDVITEIYDSCYELFQVLRELTKSIGVQHLQDCKETQELVTMLVKVLNEGLRPHLTKWQAKYRRWWSAAIEKSENAEKSPQEIQRQYPHYEELVKELESLNASFVQFAKALRTVAEGGEA